jgi:hypothetical protein
MVIADNTVANLMSRLGVYRDTVLKRKLAEAQKSLKKLSDVGQKNTLENSGSVSVKICNHKGQVKATFFSADRESELTLVSLDELRKLVLNYQVSIDEQERSNGIKKYVMKYIIPNTNHETKAELNYINLWHDGLNDNSDSIDEEIKLTHSFIAYYIYSNKTREQLEKMVRNTQRFLQVSEVLVSEERASKEDSSEGRASKEDSSEEQTSKDDAGEEQVDKDPGCLQQSLSSERKASFNELATFLSSKPTPWQSFCAALPFCPCWKKLKSPHLAMSAEINALITKSAVPLGM